MRSSARSALPTLLTCLCFAASVFAQSPGKQQVKTPRGSVSGRVTIKSKPAPGVVVGLRKGAVENSFDPFIRAVTDAEGMYRLQNVPAGSYVVTVVAPAYIPSNSEDRKSVVLGEDENVEGINFSLVRGGVITGKVTDAEGHPVIQHQIEIYSLPALARRSQQGPFPTITGQTDDRGIYRVYGIAPGSYKVAAGRSNFGGYSPNQSNFLQVFHPDAADPAKATVIELGEGSEAKDVDIMVGRAVQTYSASGRVINGDTNAPLANLRFSLQRLVGQQVEYQNSVVSSNARGDFVAEGLIPGKYSTLMFLEEGSELRAETTTFEVVDRDVTGLIVKLSRGASISGVVVLDTDNKAAKAQLAEMLLRGYVPTAPGTGYGNAVSSRVAADGSFRLAGLGTGMVSISLSGTVNPYPPKGFSISRIERDGVAATRVEVKEAEQVTGVKIFLAYGTATLRGLVAIENGSLPSGARIYVRLGKPGENTPTFMRPPIVDARGNFVVEGVPPGQYELTATVMGGGITMPKPVKKEVSVTDGVINDVRITIDATTFAPIP